jgi:hypothetical protein
MRQCITLNPKAECGRELKALTDKPCEYDYDSFSAVYATLKQRWGSRLDNKIKLIEILLNSIN